MPAAYIEQANYVTKNQAIIMDPASSSDQRTQTTTTGHEDPAHLLAQLNQRLLQLAAQLDMIHAEVDNLAARIDDDSAQVSALVSHLTDTQSTQLLQRRLADFTEEMSAEHEQLNFLGLKLTELATQDQLVRMASTVATQGQVSEVLEIVQNLVRIQDRANRLSETREEHVEALLGTLHEIVAHRQQAIDRNDQRDQEQVDAIRRAARGEFAADLLPALDGLEIALERARTILARQRHDLAALAQLTASPRTDDRGQPPPGLLDKLRSRITTEDDIGGLSGHGSAPPASMAATLSATEAWLNHLTLVRDRFVALLALEGIEPLPALNQKFDPRIHMAVDSEVRTDVPPKTVVRELRKGYRQDRRVLRYAEVVIAQAPDSTASGSNH
jgi:molecular chaperone GrpE (heat shock protein)